MHFTPVPASVAPSVPPSTPPAPAASAASATPAVGVPSTVPVRVVEDGTTNPWDVAAVLSGIVIGLVSVSLAGWALKAARDARNAVAAERRRVFELEVLRDLAALLDDDLTALAADHPATAVLYHRIAAEPYLVPHYFRGRLRMLPGEDLPLWRRLGSLGSATELGEALGLAPDEAEELRDGERMPSTALLGRFMEALQGDLNAAIERRMTARDG